VRRILVITGHAAGGDLKATILFQAEALARMGHEVQIVTVDYSLLRKVLKGMAPPAEPNKVYEVEPRLKGYVWMPLFHPLNLPVKPAVEALARLYPLLMDSFIRRAARAADTLIVESGTGMLLAPALKRLNPLANTMLMMCDLMETLPCSEVVVERANATIPLFDLVTFPAEAMRKNLKQARKALFLPQGLDKKAFVSDLPSPFPQPRQAISIGDMLFDAGTIATLADAYPDWTFHLFGRNAKLPYKVGNVIEHGEVPFAKLVPYLLHADIGIAPYRDAPFVSYISQSSLKLVQYTYCRLPIVAPLFAAAGREHVCAYQPGDKTSVIEAFETAIEFPREIVDTSQIKDWQENAQMLLGYFDQYRLDDNLEVAS
jgi:2-beta-glucuronyltransferase